MIWIDLIYNLAILMALSVFSGFVGMRWKSRSRFCILLQGVVFGAAAVVGMLRPVHLAPGIIFDGRTVMLSLCALFFGPWATATACLIMIPVRIFLQGPGMVPGVAMIVISALIGTDFHYRYRRKPEKITATTLLTLGIASHLAMLSTLFLMPADMILPLMQRIVCPVLLIYPPATVLIGKILLDQTANALLRETRSLNEQRHRIILQTAMDGYFLLDLAGRLREVNNAYCRMSGYSEKELLALSIKDLDAVYGDADVAAYFEKVITQGEDRLESQHRRKDGSIFDVAINVQYQPADGGQLVVFLQDITERIKAESSLLESERELREAQSMVQLGHWIWDVRTGGVEWSDEVYKIFRLDPKSFTPRIDSILALSPWPQEHARDQELIHRAVANHEKGTYEQRFLRPDKSIGYYQSTFQGKYDEHGNLVTIIGTVQDITERKQAEIFREIGQTILRLLGEESSLEKTIGAVLSEIKARTGLDAAGIRLRNEDGFPYFAQEGFAGDFLQTRNASISLGGDAGTPQTEGESVQPECVCSLVLSGRTDPAVPFFTRGGSYWTNDAGAQAEPPSDQLHRLSPSTLCTENGYLSVAMIPIKNRKQIIGLIHLADHRQDCFTPAVIDILEGIAAHIGATLMRRQAEESLRESEEKYRAIIMASPIPMVLNDDKQNITFLNAAFTHTFGYTLPDIPNLADWWPKAYPDERYRQQLIDTWFSELEQAQKTGTFMPIEATIHCKDGSSKTVLASASALPGSFSRTFLTVIYDITEHKRSEEELQKIQKLQSIGTLAGGIAHDFNNILQGLFGNISLAKDELAKDHPAHTLLEEAEKSLCLAVRLTKQLLTFAKGGEPVKEDVSLGALVQEVARFDLSGSPVSLSYREAEDLWQIKADKGQMQQVISNLVLNARQAMPRGGHLYVTLENEELASEAVPGLRQGRYVKVIVRDEGTGIDPKVRDRIFDPYFTTKKNGTGLGLATVFSIVTKHAGAILVDSESGRGSTFTLYLPAFRSAAPESVSPPAAENLAPHTHARVLVMDDEEPVRKLAVRILATDGYAVDTAENGQEAIDKCKQALRDGRPFALVIMDMTVPGGIGGKEAVKDILALDPNLRALVSSGYSDDPVMAAPAKFGFRGAVAKPYTPQALRTIAAQALS